jgi:hypothetical protein
MKFMVVGLETRNHQVHRSILTSLSSLEKVVINIMFGTEDSINYRFTFGHTKPQVSNDISRKPEKKKGGNQLFND